MGRTLVGKGFHDIRSDGGARRHSQKGTEEEVDLPRPDKSFLSLRGKSIWFFRNDST